MPEQVGSAFVEVGAKTDKAESGIKSLKSSMTGIGTDMAKVGAGMSLALTTPLVALGKKGIGMAADFESQMGILTLAARDTGLGFKDLSDIAIAVGGDTDLVGISASGAADAMTNFFKNGMSVGDMLGDVNGYMTEGTDLTGALRSSIDLAAASDIDLSQASMLVASTLKQFGLEGSAASAVTNQLVQVADAAAGEVSDYAAALDNVSGAASSMGIPLSDLSVALGVMAERGLMGAEAGTSLKSALLTMTKPTDAVKTALERAERLPL